MAKEYLDKLTSIIKKLKLEEQTGVQLEIRHLFTGAALYVGKTICASWSPVGLAFKLREDEVSKLISSGRAEPLKYFDKGHTKKGYALFSSPESSRPGRWKAYFEKSINNAKEAKHQVSAK